MSAAASVGAGVLAVVAASILLAGALVVWLRFGGVRGAAPLGAVLGALVGGLLGVRRAHVVVSMRRAGIADAERTATRMYARLGRDLFELLWIAGRRDRRFDELVDVGDEMRGVVELAAGRGAVVATAHTGGWDLVGCAVAEQVPLVVVTKRLSVGWIDGLWQSIRAARGMRLLTVGEVAAGARRALENGSLVAMLMDQAPERRRGVVRATFLGQPALVDLAPALIAMRARVPLVAAFAERRADGRLGVVVAGVVEPPARPTRAFAEQAMLQGTAWLDAFVRARPEQWLWMHRRWKTGVEPPGGVLRHAASEPG